MERNFATFRIQPGLKVTYKQNPPTPTSDQIDSLIPTIAETGRIKNKFSKKKKKKFRNKEKNMIMMRWYKFRKHCVPVPTPKK